MKSKRIFYDKAVLPQGAIVEMTIWQLPKATAERNHGLKYSLYYGKDGVRLVGYDNELGKGDHKHVKGVQTSYKFESVEQLVADFLADVERVKYEQHE